MSTNEEDEKAKEVTQYRAVSQVGPAVLAFANRRDDGLWSCIRLGLMMRRPALPEAEAIAWIRAEAQRYFLQHVARPGEEHMPVVVLGVTQAERNAWELKSAQEADEALWLDWRSGRRQGVVAPVTTRIGNDDGTVRDGNTRAAGLSRLKGRRYPHDPRQGFPRSQGASLPASEEPSHE
jgi:hypothetical protein